MAKNEVKVLIVGESRLDVAVRSAKASLSDLQRTANTVRSALGALGLGVGVGSFGFLIKNAGEAADAISKLSQVSGIGVEKLSGYRVAAELSGVGTEALGTGIKKMSKAMAEGNSAFAALGVSTKNADGSLRSTEDVLLDVAERFAGLEDGAGKAALAQELFGKSGTDLIPLLNDGAAALKSAQEIAKRFGLTLSQETIEGAKEAGDIFKVLEMRTSATSQQIAAGMVPALRALAEAFSDAAADSGFLDGAIKTLSFTLKSLISAGYGAVYVFKQIGRDIGAAAAALMAALSGNFAEAKEILRLRGEDQVKAQNEFAAKIHRAWEDGAQKIDLAAPKIGKKLAAPLVKSVEETQKAAKKQAEIIEKLSFAFRDAERGAELSALPELERKILGEQEKIDRLIQQHRNDLTKEHLDQLEQIAATVKKTVAERYREADAIEQAKKAQEKQQKALEKYNDEITRGLTDALMRGFEAGKDFARNFRDSLVNMFKTLVLRPVIEWIMRPVGAGITAGLAGLGIPGLASASTIAGTAGINPLSFIGGNSFGAGLSSVGDWMVQNNVLSSAGFDLAANAGMYANWQYGLAGLGGGILGSMIGGQAGGWLGGIGSTLGMAFGGPIGGVLGGAAGGLLGSLFGDDEEERQDPTNPYRDKYLNTQVRGRALREYGVGKYFEAPNFNDYNDAAVQGIQQFAQQVEALVATLEAAKASTAQFDATLNTANRTNISQLTAGLQALAAMEPEQEKQARLLDEAKTKLADLSAQLSDLGVALPSTRAEFFHLAKSSDALYEQLVKLAPEFAAASATVEAEAERQKQIAAQTAAVQAETNAEADLLRSRSVLLQSYRDEITAQQQLIEATKSWIDEVRGIQEELTLGSLSTLAPEDQLRTAQAQFERIVKSTQPGGDLSAARGAAQQYLQIGRDFYGPTAAYSALFESVQAAFGRLEAAGLDSIRNAEARIGDLRDTMRETMGGGRRTPRDDLADALRSSDEDGRLQRGVITTLADMYQRYAGRAIEDVDQEGWNYWKQEGVREAQAGRIAFWQRAFNESAAQVRAQAPSFDTGTPFVPADMPANLHRGEIVVDPRSSDVLRRYGITVKTDNAETVTELRALVRLLSAGLTEQINEARALREEVERLRRRMAA